ncbi:hypothetical protein V6N13_090130 [Hibiscus sabdariffa]
MFVVLDAFFTSFQAYLKNGIFGELFKLPKVKQGSGRRWHPLEGKKIASARPRTDNTMAAAHQSNKSSVFKEATE